MVLAGNKAKRLSSVNHTTKTIHHHHHHHPQCLSVWSGEGKNKFKKRRTTPILIKQFKKLAHPTANIYHLRQQEIRKILLHTFLLHLCCCGQSIVSNYFLY